MVTCIGMLLRRRRRLLRAGNGTPRRAIKKSRARRSSENGKETRGPGRKRKMLIVRLGSVVYLRHPFLSEAKQRAAELSRAEVCPPLGCKPDKRELMDIRLYSMRLACVRHLGVMVTPAIVDFPSATPEEVDLQESYTIPAHLSTLIPASTPCNWDSTRTPTECLLPAAKGLAESPSQKPNHTLDPGGQA